MIHYNEAAGLSDVPDIVANAIDDLAPHRDEFDSIAAQGASGLIVASPVALLLAKPLVVVRKNADMPDTRCIHKSMVENAQNAGQRVLFLDDYVGEGKTLRDVLAKISAHTAGEVTARYETVYREFVTGPAVKEARIPWASTYLSDLLARHA